MSEACQNIRKVIQSEEAALRQGHRWLRHQDLIGFFLFAASTFGFVISGVAYYRGYLPAWLCIPVSAVFLSIGHEIEHDLLHGLYFQRRKILKNFLLLVGWISRGTTINPWIRRQIHLYHHQYSGEFHDAEERLIGNGMDYKGLKRWLVMLGPWFAPVQAKSLRESGCPLRALPLVLSLFPMVGLTSLFIVYWLLLHILGPTLFPWGQENLPIWNALMVAYIAPNVLRMFCLQFISSSIHYLGDVRDLSTQTQVLNSWHWIPFQLFCFNFGATHALHHFFPNQPFYIRQWLSSKVFPVMRAQGIRFNDLGTFQRNNRYGAI